jgi:glucose-1-phosphate adenylyltransferase
MSQKKVLAFVLAFGNDTHPESLTEVHSTPALHFAHGYRLIDFALSNLVNSAIENVYVLLQTKPHSLIEHVRRVWQHPYPGGTPLASPLLCEVRVGGAPIPGTADAVRRNLHLIERHRPDVVAILAGDQVCRMDVRQMLGFHEVRRSAVTAAVVPVPMASAMRFGIISTHEGGRIEALLDRPRKPTSIPEDPAYALASTGNWLFEPQALIRLLDATRDGGRDFEHDVMPRAVGSFRAFAYDLSNNHIPGSLRSEERGYWRDVGTPRALQTAREDTLRPAPRLWLSNPLWPLRPESQRPHRHHGLQKGSWPALVREYRRVPGGRPLLAPSSRSDPAG